MNSKLKHFAIGAGAVSFGLIVAAALKHECRTHYIYIIVEEKVTKDPIHVCMKDTIYYNQIIRDTTYTDEP